MMFTFLRDLQYKFLANHTIVLGQKMIIIRLSASKLWLKRMSPQKSGNVRESCHPKILTGTFPLKCDFTSSDNHHWPVGGSFNKHVFPLKHNLVRGRLCCAANLSLVQVQILFDAHRKISHMTSRDEVKFMQKDYLQLMSDSQNAGVKAQFK